MQVRVNLPPGSLIDYLDFCEAIAQAVCPTDEHGPKGIDCIVAKKVTRHVPITPHHVGEWQSVLISADGRTLDELVSSEQSAPAGTGELELLLTEPEYPCYQVGELSGQFNLTDGDRRTLEKLLPKLPPLRSPMPEDEVAAFMDAYLRLPDHPAWEPVLISTTIENCKAEQDAIRRRHQQMLQDELACGRLVAVNHDHVQVATLGAGFFIPRSQAIAYLERYGFAHSDMRGGEDRGDVAPEETAMPPEASTGKRNNVGKPKYSDKKRRQIADESRALRDKGQSHVTPIAEKYGYSEKQIYNLVKEADQEDQERKEAMRRLVVGPT